MSADSLNSGCLRRTYTRQFKTEMAAQCMQGKVSLASLAVEHGMNPNVLHRWVTEHGRYGHHILSDDDQHEQGTTALMVPTPQSTSPFLPVPLSTSQSAVGNETIRLELKRGATTVSVSWPVNAAVQCAKLLREWLR